MSVRVFKKARLVLFLIFAACAGVMLLSCSKKEKGAEGEENQDAQVEENTNEYDFYLPSDDDASWVESLLARVEEERIAEELAKMEESVSEYQLDEDDFAEDDEADSDEEGAEENGEEEEINPIEKFFEEAREGRALTDKKQEMRFYEFDNEILSSQQTEDGLVVVHSNGNNVIRNFYDVQYNLIKKEEWNIKSASDSSILKTEAFVYSEETNKVVQKDITTPSYFESVLYNEEKSPVSAKRYNLKDEERFIVRERFWAYDAENQLIRDEQKEYTYADAEYKTEPEVFIRRYEYKYPEVVKADGSAGSSEVSEGAGISEAASDTATDSGNSDNSEKSEIPPDSKYYENNVLKMKNVYTDQKGTWVSTVYFDENLSVKTYYEDDVRVRDEYYNRGRLFRTKIYEKQEAAPEDEQTVIKQGEE